MGRTTLTLVGCALGALLVLALHPFTRAYFNPFAVSESSRVLTSDPLLPQNVSIVPRPDERLVAAYWLLLAAHMVDASRLAEEPNLSTWIDLAATNRTLDPENSFWPQMESALLWEQGKREESKAQWLRASRATRWDDYQSDRLLRIQKSLANESGATFAWHWALLYHERDDAIANLLYRHTDRMSRLARESGATDYSLLMASIRNARLLRDGSRRLDIHATSQRAVESSYSQPDKGQPLTERKRHEARLNLINEFKSHGEEGQADEVAATLRDNAAWSQILDRIPADKANQSNAALAVALYSLPSSLIVSGALGACFVGLAWVLRRAAAANLVNQKSMLWVGAVVAAGVGLVTERLTLGVVTAMIFAFLSSSATQNQRPLHVSVFTERVLRTSWVMMLLASGWFTWSTQSAGYQSLAAFLPVPAHLGGRTGPAFFLEAWLLLMPFIFAATIAKLQRRSSIACLDHTLNTCGQALFVWSIGCAIVCGTFSAFADHRLGEDLRQVTLNEPLYYFREP